MKFALVVPHELGYARSQFSYGKLEVLLFFDDHLDLFRPPPFDRSQVIQKGIEIKMIKGSYGENTF